jgi:two-component system response regulator FixJ
LLTNELPVRDACLLLDIYMPGMSGLELRRTLAESGRDLPIILMSGLDDQRTRSMMRESKPHAVLFKPFDEKALLAALRKALGGWVKPHGQARRARLRD